MWCKRDGDIDELMLMAQWDHTKVQGPLNNQNPVWRGWFDNQVH